MRQQSTRWGLLVMVLLISFLGWPRLIRAATQPPAANFQMTPLLPKNQLNAKDSYFNLKVVPGTTQQLKLAVSNPTAKAKTLQITPINATTADVGNAVYVPSSRIDSSAVTTFTRMTSPGVTVTLAPKQAKTVTFKTVIPKQKFAGEILGGLFVTDTASSGATPRAKQAFALKNRYAEVAAVALWCQPQQRVPVKLQLASVGVVTPADQQPQVVAKLRNLAPILFGQLNVQAAVIQSQTGKTVATQRLKNGSMAPNSWFNYGVALGSQPLSAGNYVLKLRLRSGQRKWNFTRTFTVNAQMASAHNHHIKRPASVNWWLWGSVAAGLLLILMGAAYRFGRRRSRR